MTGWPDDARPGVPLHPERDGEEWRPVVGYEGLYEVSSLGRVKSAAAGRGRVQGRVLRQSARNAKGYMRVNLWNGTQRNHFTHHLVAAAFIGPRPAGLLVLHENGRADDNKASNLRYGTHRENVADAKRHGTFRPGHVRGDQHGAAKLTAQIVRDIRSICSPRFAELARQHGVDEAAIRQAWNGRTWRHV
jgi:hypothetical protein